MTSVTVPLRIIRGDATSPQVMGHVLGDHARLRPDPDYRTSVHMPRIGCGLAGGRWDLVEPLVQARLCARGVPVTIYDHT